MFSPETKNGEVIKPRLDAELDRRPAMSGSHKITRLDGTSLEWRMGERLPFTFTSSGKTINLRPASFVMLGMLTKIAREHYGGIMGYDAESNKIKSAVNAQKLQVTIKELGEIEKKGGDEEEKRDRREKAVTKAMVGGDGEVEAKAEQRMRELTYLANDLSDEGQFKAAQYIFLDASDDRDLQRWKEDRRPPKTEELDAALPRDKYDYDYTGIEMKDLIHVYYQLNFLPAVEKKSYLNLMIP